MTRVMLASCTLPIRHFPYAYGTAGPVSVYFVTRPAHQPAVVSTFRHAGLRVDRALCYFVGLD